MSNNKSRQKSTASTLITLAIIAIFMLWQYVFQPKQNNQTTQKTTSKSAQKIVQNSDYDYIMSQDSIGANPNASVDYYLLALSWSPAFCEQQRKKYGKNLPESAQMQCESGQQYGWVIHGLWPQSNAARDASEHPRFCQGDLPKLSQELLQSYLTESPSLNLLQGEWEKHGACAFKQAKDYFDKQSELFHSLKLPNKQLNRGELFAWVKKNNPQLADKYLNASRTELFICYDLNWNVIDCPK